MDAININCDELNYALMVAGGVKTVETRGTNSLKSHIGQRVYICATGRGRTAQIVGECTIGEPVHYTDEADFYADAGKHLVTRYSRYAFRGEKYGYPIIDPVLYEAFFTPPAGGMVIRKNVLPNPWWVRIPVDMRGNRL